MVKQTVVETKITTKPHLGRINLIELKTTDLPNKQNENNLQEREHKTIKDLQKIKGLERERGKNLKKLKSLEIKGALL